MRIKAGDTVRVLKGKDRGREGKVERAFPATGKVIVEGVNVAKRHTKSKDATSPGGIIDKLMPLDASNVAIICNKCGPTRIGIRRDEFGKKVRICKKCGGDL
jgi:large subunit ribosomal protein L24